MKNDFKKTKEIIKSLDPLKRWGRVTKLEGGLIEGRGFQPKMKDVCEFKNDFETIKAEVIGFSRESIQLMAFENNFTFDENTLVRSLGDSLKIKVGKALLGRVVNGLGEPIDGKPLFTEEEKTIYSSNSNVLDKEIIDTPVALGIKSIDGLLTIGRGQRMGVFSGSGVGKSTLLAMIARNNQADVNVIALVGERGREVKEFINHYLGEEGLKKSVLVVSTSDDAALARVKSVFTATTIAEYFRDLGLNVVLMVDSLTRLAHAQRIVGTYLQEPPTTRGFPPSLFELLPKFLERAGNFKKGSITGIYSVLVEGDDLEEPITDAVRGILDGHIVLAKKIAQRALYPAIDVTQSISRLMPSLVSQSHLEQAHQVKEWLASYYEMEDLVNVGAYVSGSNPVLDEALNKIAAINDFLKQGISENIGFDQTMENLASLFVPVE